MALDALVVGAGPVGLVMAAELSRHGLSCRIIDQGEGPSIWSKAQIIHARTLECFHDMGVIDPILARGRQVAGARILSPTLERIARVEIGGIDSPYAFLLSLSQRETEIVLAEHLERAYGVKVERKVKLQGFSQDEGGVTAALAAEDGWVEEVRVPYLLGCDGSHSTVRKTLDLPFEGSTYDVRLMQADVRVELPVAVHDDEIAIFLGPNGMLGFFPLPGEGRYRMLTFVDPSDDRPVELETFQALLKERGPAGSSLGDPAWMIDFRIHCRLAPHYRVGRVFLSGDAAHIHSPAGGQGMNMGIQDAYNLAWKLALVARGVGRDALLDSYEAERRPVAAETLRFTDVSTRGLQTALSLKSPLTIGIRNHLMNFVTSLGFVKERAGRTVSQIEVAYPKSPIVGQDQSSLWNIRLTGSDERPGLSDWIHFGDGPAPGARVPDMPVGSDTLHNLLRGTQHTLLCFDGAAATNEGYERLGRIVNAARARLGERVRAYVIVPGTEVPTALPADVPVLSDPDGELHRRFGARSESIYMVRPDGYVGYRSQPADEEKLAAWLDRLFV
ncbi:FAD-dependent monooxygenase [Polyangium sp. y55x31]|uniref:FAD-dependent monooxygenase n=1 Tax=Polyangium sp. y55x31 TaxID=3042688 RepID=UPI002482FD2C|nr:FAD-dependent monooxygenase [Polyangium sp. y55x31]MDI1480914.1 FAD-dependent monooxygenase [Polyangium sp. y55x31]